MLRAFYSEGYVNVYKMEVVESDDLTLIFTTERTENAGDLRARLRYDLKDDEELIVSLDLSRPGEEWRECQVVYLRRKEHRDG